MTGTVAEGDVRERLVEGTLDTNKQALARDDLEK